MSSHPFKPDWATHPGDHLKEYLDSNGISQQEFGRRCGLRSNFVSELCRRQTSVTREIADKLAGATPYVASIWLNLQKNWDEHQAKQPKALHPNRRMGKLV